MESRPARSSTSVLGTLSCHLIPRMRLRHRRWKLFSFFSWAAYVDHASLEYRRVLRTQALYTFIFVFSVRLLLDHTLLWSLDITAAAFAHPVVDLRFQGDIGADDRPQVLEPIDHVEFLTP